MTTKITPAKTSLSRVFLIEGRAHPAHAASYQAFMRAGAAEQAFGDVEKIEVPSSKKMDAFETVGQVRSAEDRATTSLEGRYAIDLKSTLLRLARAGCAVDLHVNLGECKDPTQFNVFDKKLIFESAILTNFSTGDLGTLESGNRAAINETAEISADSWYEVMNLSFAQRDADVITNELLDVIVCDTANCGDCDDESDGCQKIFSISKAAGGSPSTPADVVFSLDGAATWDAHDIDSLGAANDPDAIACVGTYIVVVSNAGAAHHYATKSDFDGTTDPSFTEVTGGYVALSEPNDIWSWGSGAYIVGDGGYVYKLTDATVAPTVVDAGQATTDNLLAVHAPSEDLAVAAGENGTVIYTLNGTTWTSVALRPVGAGVHINAVWVKGEKEWWIGTSGGELYYTIDQGKTWTLKAFSGSGSGTVYDIAFAADSIAYLSHATSANAGRILRSYDGGNTWALLPEGAANMPANDRFTAIAACEEDVNFVVGVGLADDGSDGFIAVGEG